MTIVAPSILSADFSRLESQIALIEQAGADWVHIDVMDGRFVPNITIGPVVVKHIKKHSRLFFDVHLMIEDPDRYVDDFIDAGADMVVVHAEATRHLHRSIQKIKKSNCKAGVALNPATPLDVLDYVLPDLDMVLLMAVNPGFGGQSFIPEVIGKIATLRKKLQEAGAACLIEVDGGVNLENAAEVVRAGADVLVAGSAVYGSNDPVYVVRELKKL